MEYEAVIGLEIHVELQTRSKLFCGCSTSFGAEPNTNCCPVCLGLPGTLPVLNRRAIEYAVMAALALGGTVQEESRFDRKNYFYPGLPKAYRISQYDHPLALAADWVDFRTVPAALTWSGAPRRGGGQAGHASDWIMGILMRWLTQPGRDPAA